MIAGFVIRWYWQNPQSLSCQANIKRTDVTKRFRYDEDDKNVNEELFTLKYSGHSKEDFDGSNYEKYVTLCGNLCGKELCEF